MRLDKPSPQWDDAALVEQCLEGNAQAWEALLQKYKRLIYAVILRYRFQPEDAADVFQAVCIDLYQELRNLRESGALRGWLARVAANKCFHHKQRQNRGKQESLSDDAQVEDAAAPLWLEEAERDQQVREALARLSPRCREMLRMLFYEDPPRPYEEVARSLGLATGSIGFTRGRCLKSLAQELEKAGL